MVLSLVGLTLVSVRSKNGILHRPWLYEPPETGPVQTFTLCGSIVNGRGWNYVPDAGATCKSCIRKQDSPLFT